jgi:hypothetical protein
MKAIRMFTFFVATMLLCGLAVRQAGASPDCASDCGDAFNAECTGLVAECCGDCQEMVDCMNGCPGGGGDTYGSCEDIGACIT